MNDVMQVPDGWDISKLLDVCDIVGGGTPARDNPQYWNGDIPWVSPTEITGLTCRYLSKSNECITEKGLKECSAKLLPTGTVLMTSRASIGFPAINTVPVTTNQGFQSLICKEGKLYNEFLYQLILFKRNTLTKLSAGSTFLEISSTNLKRVKFILPSLPEQKKIASILTSVDDVIEKTEAQISKLQDLKKGMMTELLTKGIGHTEFKDSPVGRIPLSWEIKRLDKIASLQRGHDLTKKQMVLGEYPVVSSSGTTGFHNQYKTGSPAVLVGRKGSIGTVHFYETNVWAHDTSLYVTDFHGNSERYIYYLFCKLDLQQYGTKSGSPSLNRNDIHILKIPLPSVTEQFKIASAIKSVDDTIDKKHEKLFSTKSLKKALMNDLLTGRKRVNVT